MNLTLSPTLRNCYLPTVVSVARGRHGKLSCPGRGADDENSTTSDTHGEAQEGPLEQERAGQNVRQAKEGAGLHGTEVRS